MNNQNRTYAFIHTTASAGGPRQDDFQCLGFPDPLHFVSPSLDYNLLPHSVFTIGGELQHLFIRLITTNFVQREFRHHAEGNSPRVVDHFEGLCCSHWVQAVSQSNTRGSKDQQ
jgi:hypothetical protein